jgi:energy-coupling factor transport system ATP-binding protein
MNFMDAIVQMPAFDAILFITHDVDLAVIYANRVLIVANGQLVADGPPSQVLADFDRLRACRLVPTTLLAENLRALPHMGGFYRAEVLAHNEGVPGNS